MMRLWFVGLCALALCGWGATPSFAADEAEDEGLSLMVEDEEGHEYDLFDECGDNVLICFIKPDALDDESIDELVALLEEIGDDEEAAAALRRVPGVVMVADEDEDEDEEGEELDVVLVIIGDEECWDEAEEAFGDAEDLTVVLASDDDEELFETFDLPEDFAWVVVLVENGAVDDESYDSIDELKAAEDELEGALDEEE